MTAQPQLRGKHQSLVRLAPQPFSWTEFDPREVPSREHGLIRQIIADVRAGRLMEWFDVSSIGAVMGIDSKPESGNGDPRCWIGIALRFWSGMLIRLDAFRTEDRVKPYDETTLVPVIQGVGGWSKNRPYHLGAPLHVMSNFLAWLDTFIVVKTPSPTATLLERQVVTIEDALMMWVTRSRGGEARTIDVQNWIGALLGHQLEQKERAKLSRALESLVKAGILKRNASHGQRFTVAQL